MKWTTLNSIADESDIISSTPEEDTLSVETSCGLIYKFINKKGVTFTYTEGFKTNIHSVGSHNVHWYACGAHFNKFIKLKKRLTFIVARSLRGRCTQHLRRIRGCDAHPAWIRRKSGANVTQMLRTKFAYDVRHVACVSCRCCALPRVERATRDVTFGPLCNIVSFHSLNARLFNCTVRYDLKTHQVLIVII
jgi:hypothetical protein